MKEKLWYTRRAKNRRIWLKHISGIPHWAARLIGKRHGKVGIPRMESAGWTSAYIERKQSCYAAYTNKEYAFCDQLLSYLRVEARKLGAGILLLEQEQKRMLPAVEDGLGLSGQARMAKLIFAEREQAKRKITQSVVRMAEIKEIILCVEEIVAQRCDRANQLFRGHIMAYWTGILQTHADASSTPVLALPNETAKEKYDLQHNQGWDEINNIVCSYRNPLDLEARLPS